MKKAMVIAAFALLVGSLQADTITWAVDSFTVSADGSVGSQLVGVPVYLLYGDSTGVGASIEGGSFLVDYSGAILATQPTHGGGGIITYSPVGLPSLSNEDFFIVAFDGAYGSTATEYTISASIQSSTVSETGDPPPPPNTVQYNYGSMGAWQPVPEPGTIILALAGIGAFVARRRRNRK